MVRCESRSSTIGHITLGTKQTGAPSAGNPHAGCDVAGAGNGFTVWLLRHSQRKRGATGEARPSEYRASPRPNQVPIGTAPADEAGLSPVVSAGAVSIGSFELSRWRLRRVRGGAYFAFICASRRSWCFWVRE